MNLKSGLSFIFLLFLGIIHAKPLILSIEGSPGAGKSTLLRILEKELNVTVIEEAFDAWNDINGKGNLFKLFSSDPIRWAFTQNLYATITKLQRYQASKALAHDSGILIFDRSFLADQYIFGRINTERNYWQPLEQELFRIITNFIINQTECAIDGIIYLRTEPEICKRRVEIRNNSAKHPLNFNREFYEYFHSLHEDWLEVQKNRDSDIPVLIINGNVDFEHDEYAHDVIADQIRGFIKQLNWLINELPAILNNEIIGDSEGFNDEINANTRRIF